jgi:hypothetical protein
VNVVDLSTAHRFEAYIAGSLLLLLGLLLLAFLGNIIAVGQLPALFLTGIGVIFLVIALLKSMAPVPHEMPAKATLAYGTIAFVIGVLWFVLSVQAVFVGYVLAIVLIFFGLLFLAHTRIRHPSS